MADRLPAARSSTSTACWSTRRTRSAWREALQRADGDATGATSATTRRWSPERVHPAGLPASHVRQAAHERRPRGARVLRRARRRDRASSDVRRPQAVDGRRAHRGRASSPPTPTRCASSSRSRTPGSASPPPPPRRTPGLFLRQIRLDTFAAGERDLDSSVVTPGLTLLDFFDADVSGRDFAHGKPAPRDLPDRGASELGVAAARMLRRRGRRRRHPGGQGGRHGGARHRARRRRGLLAAAGADLVVTTLDDVDLTALAEGRLASRKA